VAALHQGDLTGRSTALAPLCLLLCFGNSVNSKEKGRKGRQAGPSPFPIRYATGSGEPFAASGTLGDLAWLEDFLTSK